MRTKLRFFTPTEARVMLAPTSKRPEERDFVVDSGASMHMLSKKDLSSDEMETLRRSRITTTVATASGEVQTSGEAQVYIHDLDLFVTVQLLEDNACCSITWKTLRTTRIFIFVGQRSTTTVDQKWEDYHLQNGQFRASCRSRVIHQFWKRFVLYIATTGLVEKRSRTSLKKKKMAIEIRTTVCEIFLRTHFSGLGFGTSCRSGDKIENAQYLNSLSERLKL